MKQRKFGFNPGSLLLMVVFAACLLWVMGDSMADEKPGYSQVRQLFQQEKVSEFTVEDNILTVTLREEVDGKTTYRHELYDFDYFYDDLNELVREQADKGILRLIIKFLNGLNLHLKVHRAVLW